VVGHGGGGLGVDRDLGDVVDLVVNLGPNLPHYWGSHNVFLDSVNWDHSWGSMVGNGGSWSSSIGGWGGSICGRGSIGSSIGSWGSSIKAIGGRGSSIKSIGGRGSIGSWGSGVGSRGSSTINSWCSSGITS